MRTRMWLTNLSIYLVVGSGTAAVVSAQAISPPMGSYYNYPYGYGPNPYYDAVPRPPVGSYLPQQPPVPPFPSYVVPPGEIIPPPYPHVYQPPLYQPYSYVRPYYPPSQIRPYYYGRPYPYPQPGYRPTLPNYRRVRPQRRLNVAPVGSENANPAETEERPLSDTPAPPPAREPNQP